MRDVPQPELRGIVPALITPFSADERIDYDALQVIVDTLLGAGVHGIFAGGSSGEFCSLDWDERLATMRFCRKAVPADVTLYANVGCITTRDTVRMAQVAEEFGADVVVVVTPYYLRPSPEELAEHYIAACRAVRVPVVAYNFPHHGGVDLLPETVGQIGARCENLAGVKDSSGRLDLAQAFRTCVPGRELAVFVGPERLILQALDAGCAGSVTGGANIAPDLLVSLYRAFREGNREECVRLQTLATQLDAVCGLHTFPSMIKQAMNMLGLPAGVCRKPVGAVPAENSEVMAAALGKLGLVKQQLANPVLK